jgi:alkyl sulfatase BDS1-like metallo-beta-lactamase superfamily hydrolase
MEEYAVSDPREATDATISANREVLDTLPFSDRQDFEDAARGLIAPLPDGGVITDDAGQVVWDLTRFSFLGEHDHAPDTVNPSLWRQSQLVVQGGLYKVVDRLYQVRSADLSNLTIVEGDTGLIVFDPLLSVPTAKAAMELYYEHRPRKPVGPRCTSAARLDSWTGRTAAITPSPGRDSGRSLGTTIAVPSVLGRGRERDMRKTAFAEGCVDTQRLLIDHAGAQRTNPKDSVFRVR